MKEPGSKLTDKGRREPGVDGVRRGTCATHASLCPARVDTDENDRKVANLSRPFFAVTSPAIPSFLAAPP